MEPRRIIYPFMTGTPDDPYYDLLCSIQDVRIDAPYNTVGAYVLSLTGASVTEGVGTLTFTIWGPETKELTVPYASGRYSVDGCTVTLTVLDYYKVQTIDLSNISIGCALVCLIMHPAVKSITGPLTGANGITLNYSYGVITVTGELPEAPEWAPQGVLSVNGLPTGKPVVITGSTKILDHGGIQVS